eukprot:GHVN01083479.1.p1 GENE.GHVN01083479.1~~GHVN01083479.1.p1  ORF type:complete len:873 (-),score=206.74 GHVN01083479.1:1309-3927(-)
MPKKGNAAKQEAAALRSAQKQAKQELKAAKKEMKQPGGEQSQLEALMSSADRDLAKRVKAVGVHPCGEPSPRSYYTLSVAPSGAVYLFGGEITEGKDSTVTREMFRYTPPRAGVGGVEGSAKESPTRKRGKGVEKDETNFPNELPDSELNLMGSPPYPAATAQGPSPVAPQPDEADEVVGPMGAWKRIDCPTAPKPRCSHQTVCYKGSLYMFGGEFAAGDQFFHFRDFWRFDLKSNTWEEVKAMGQSPSARSGHRMVVWRNRLVLFGGFHDTFRETKYHNDLYLYSFSAMKWEKVNFPTTANIPCARSGFQMVAHSDGVYVSGGYSKVKNTSRSAQGKIHTDTWFLHLKPISEKAEVPGRPEWQRLSHKGVNMAKRSGAQMVGYKNLGVTFGGVQDEDKGGVTLTSVFFNDIHALDMDRRRWYRMDQQLFKRKQEKAAKRKAKTGNLGEGGEEGGGKTRQQEEAGESNCVENEKDGNHKDDAEGDEGDDAGSAESRDVSGWSEELSSSQTQAIGSEGTLLPAPGGGVVTAGAGGSVLSTMLAQESTGLTSVAAIRAACVEAEWKIPLPRFNPQLAMISGNRLLVMGGVVEVGHKISLTLDDIWTFTLSGGSAATPSSRWQCVSRGTVPQRIASLNELEANSEDDSDSCEEDSDETEEGDSDFSDYESDGLSEVSDSDEVGDSVTDEEERDKRPSEASKTTVASSSAALPPSMSKRQKKNAKKRKEERILTWSEILKNEILAVCPGISQPEEEEKLNEYFQRTKHEWVSKMVEVMEAKEETLFKDTAQQESGDVVTMTNVIEGGFKLADLSNKELSERAFQVAGVYHVEIVGERSKQDEARVRGGGAASSKGKSSSEAAVDSSSGRLVADIKL